MTDQRTMIVPEGLAGAAAKMVVRKMIVRGWLEEVEANLTRREPLWRETGDGHGTTLIATEAGLDAIGIEPLVANSPLMSWVYGIFSVTAFSAILGVVELVTAVLLAVKPWWPTVSLAGSVAAIGLFCATISFLVTTPGIGEASAGGFPALSSTGQFLVKDIALLGVAIWTMADAMRIHRAGAGGSTAAQSALT